jgi:hypothetical protein
VSDADPGTDEADRRIEDVPSWEDEYLDRVSDRLMFNYDLEKDFAVRGERFALYGAMRAESYKQFVHSSINYANHAAAEYVFARRVPGVGVGDLEALVALADDLADEWIDANEEHYSTDFTFVLVAPELPEAVRSFVRGFQGRTLLKYGYYGHYETNLVVVAPEAEEIVASANADVAQAFALWTDEVQQGQGGWVSRLLRRLRG